MMQGMMMPQHMMGQRPLFPATAAIPQAAALNQQQKPTFPAYSNATISAPPTTNLANPSGTTSSSNSNETQKPPTIPQNTGTASKIIHPPEDISLEELKARKPQYKINKPSTPTSSAASSIAATTAMAVAKANEAKMVAAAQEVSQLYLIALSSELSILFSYCIFFYIFGIRKFA